MKKSEGDFWGGIERGFGKLSLVWMRYNHVRIRGFVKIEFLDEQITKVK